MFVEWELSAAIDQEGRMLPGRQFLRDVCTRRYRRYAPTDPAAAGDGYVYPKIFPCPYTGSNAFTALGVGTTVANDVCGRKVSDCRLRFPGQALPMGAFPGIGRVPT
jgi:phage-related protein